MKAASQKQFLYCIVSINIYLKVAGAKRVLEIQQSTYISISFLDWLDKSALSMFLFVWLSIPIYENVLKLKFFLKIIISL